MEKSADNMPRIEPRQLTLESRFRFSCHKGLECFTRCCRGINIVLTPYDVIRMKQRLGLDSEQFLAVYTEIQLLEKTDLPVPSLRLLDDAEQSCPFVREGEGCIIYEDRPSACRYYPVGHATLRPKEGDDSEQFYFFVREPHCKGFESEKEWTVASWRKDQGVDQHDLANAGWIELMVRKRSFPPNIRFSTDAKKLFYMASYDMDRFRRFVLESSFLALNPLDEKTLEAIKTDDAALMRLGHEWLKGVLFSKGTMAPDKERVVARMEKRTAEKNKGQ